MNNDYKTIPHSDPFEVARYDHGLIFDEHATSRLGTALQGVQAVLTILQRHALDEELRPGAGLTFGPEITQGLIAAAATCTEFVQTAIDGQGDAVHAFYGTPAYAHLEAARLKVLSANRTPAATSKKRGAA